MFCLGIKPHSRFIQHDDLWLIHERPCDKQPAFHASGKLLDLCLLSASQLQQFQISNSLLPCLWSRNIKVTGKDKQIFQDAEIRIEVLFLRNNTNEGFDLPWFSGNIHSGHKGLPGRDRRGGSDHPDQCSFASPIWPQQPKTLASLNLQVNSGHSSEIPVFFDNGLGFDCYHIMSSIWGSLE